MKRNGTIHILAEGRGAGRRVGSENQPKYDCLAARADPARGGTSALTEDTRKRLEYAPGSVK